MFLRNFRHARRACFIDSRLVFHSDADLFQNFHFARKQSSGTEEGSKSEQNSTSTDESSSAETDTNIGLTQSTMTQPTPSGETSDGTATQEDEQRKHQLQIMAMEFIGTVDEASLSPQQLAIHKAHVNALMAGEMSYQDPLTGYDVMSKLAHLHRGDCCGNACRHCPFGMKNVPEELQEKRFYNSAFYEESGPGTIS